LCFPLWCCCSPFDPPTIWVNLQCHYEFHGGASSLPWFCAFSWITRLTKEFHFCC
jgi:hypothetical protein